ncbi:tripartite tricarboxylate transporter substrate binding protein [Lampropedia puyangensis]|uniref:Tripartite tricarboxylate transporter substrate binding protein n=1 Tax=Lampropedia puyangensis TaxID=1330072 RepID=A0A4S8FD59_9BURK|nr:tripartite tricarboxylate transporter substrate binding protein [Lampropedia puyangensis]THU03792.1 tripartite tricarboxylate transporter substrate binding protein [Lampropedia puyangensis]
MSNQHFHQRRTLLKAASCAGLGVIPAFSLPAIAGSSTPTYPTRAIKLVVGIGAGSTTDLLARVAGKHLSEALGQPVVIENRPGAGGTLGAGVVAAAKPDGHTLLFVSSSLPTFPSFYDKLRFDPVHDLIGAGGLAQGGMVMLTRANAPWKNLNELIDYAQSRPAQTISYASAGIGSIAYLYSELLAQLTGIEFLHVPYPSSAAAMTDLMAGQVDFVFDGTTTAIPQAKSGRSRALAYSAEQRSPFMPEVPTLKEAGVTGFSQRTWFGFAAPKGTDISIIQAIATASEHFNANASYQAELADAFHEPMPMSATAFNALIQEEATMWSSTIAKIRKPS